MSSAACVSAPGAVGHVASPSRSQGEGSGDEAGRLHVMTSSGSDRRSQHAAPAARPFPTHPSTPPRRPSPRSRGALGAPGAHASSSSLRSPSGVEGRQRERASQLPGSLEHADAEADPDADAPPTPLPAPTTEAARAGASEGAIVTAAAAQSSHTHTHAHARAPLVRPLHTSLDPLDQQLEALLDEIDRPLTPASGHVSTPISRGRGAVAGAAVAGGAFASTYPHSQSHLPRKRTPAPAIAYMPGSSPVAGPSLVLSDEGDEEELNAALDAAHTDHDVAVGRVMQFPIPAPLPSTAAGLAAAATAQHSPARAGSSLIRPSASSSPSPPPRLTDSPSGRRSLLASTPLRQSTLRPSTLALELATFSSPSSAPHSAPKQSRVVSFALEEGSAAAEPASGRRKTQQQVWLPAPAAPPFVPGIPGGSKHDAATADTAGGTETWEGSPVLHTTLSIDAGSKPAPIHSPPGEALTSRDSGIGSGSDAADADTDPDADLMSCWCIRPHRWAIPRRFPSDAEIAAGPSKADRARMAAAGMQVSPELAAYDRALAADFIAPIDSAYERGSGGDDGDVDTAHGPFVSSADAYAVVHAWRHCWLSVMSLAASVVGSYEWLKLPLLSLMHLNDAALDLAMLCYWGTSDAFARHPHRTDFIVAGAVFFFAPVAVTAANDVWLWWTRDRGKDRDQQQRHADAVPLLLLLLINVVQMRGLYESFLTLREYSLSRASLTAGSAGPSPSGSASALTSDSTSGSAGATAAVTRRPTSTPLSMTTESSDMTSTHLTRIILQCAPMAMLQAGALALQYQAQADASGPGASAASVIVPPSGPWLGLSVTSVLTSLSCVAITVHRYVTADPSWRRKAGPAGILALACALTLHPLLKVGGLALLVLISHWWIAVLVGFGSALVTGGLLVAADAASPRRKANVATMRGVARTMLLLAPCEYVTGGIGASDLVDQTAAPLLEARIHAHATASSVVHGSPGRGQAARWAREYWPVVVWHAAESAVIAGLYAHRGSLWPQSITAFMAACIVAKVFALAFLLPRINE